MTAPRPILLLLLLSACCTTQGPDEPIPDESEKARKPDAEKNGELLRPEEPSDAQRANPGLH